MFRSAALKFTFVLTLICLVYTVASTSVLLIDPMELGLVSRLPPIYWVGLVLLGCLWYFGFDSKYYSVAALILTVSYLFIVPVLIRAPVWISNSYYPFGESLLINSEGHLIDHPSVTIVSYHYWPMFLYFASAFTLITSIPHDILLKFFPLLTVSLYGLLSVLILRVKLKFSYAVIGASWLLASFFIRQQYFGPQAIAYIFFLVTILVVTWLFFDVKANQRTLLAVLLFLFIFTVFLHPLTSFMSLILFFGLYFVYRFVLKKTSASLGTLCLVATVVWFGYNSYLATGFFNTGIRHFYQLFSGARPLSIYSEMSRLIGSPAMQMYFISSWAIVILGVAIALLSILQIVKRIKTKTPNIEYHIFNAVILVMLGLFAFGGEYGTHEAYQRAFMFGLLPLSYLCVYFLARKPKILVVLVVGLIFLNIPAQYGSDTFRAASQNQIKGTRFVADYTPDEISLVGKFSLYIRYNNPLKRYTIISAGLSVPFTTLPNSTAIEDALSKADYTMLSNLQHNLFLFYIGEDPMEKINFRDFNRIYDNEGFRLLEPMNKARS